MRLVFTVVSLLVVLVVGGLLARSQLRAHQPLLSTLAAGASSAAAASAGGAAPTAPVAALVDASASGAAEPTPAQQKQFMDSLSKIMQQKSAPNDGDGK